MISIVIPTFNRSDLLPDAIESVLVQRAEADELIIVDDGSTDETRTVVEPYVQRACVRYVWQRNQGRSEARNHGARLAQGTWLGFLDSDDAYAPGALAEVRSTTKAHPEIGMLVGSINVVDSYGNLIERSSAWDAKTDLTLKGWLFHCYGVPSSIFIRRDWFDKVGGFDRTCETVEDWDLYLRLARLGCPMMTLPGPICNYRRHEGNSTRAIEKHVTAAIRVLDQQFDDQGLDVSLKHLRQRAAASLYLTMAVQAVEFGHRDVAASLLDEARRCAPDFVRENRIATLENMLSLQQRDELVCDVRQLLDGVLPPGMTPSNSDVYRAQARVAMRRFFQTQHTDSLNAWNNLKVALTLDPSWFFNGGVLSFLLRVRPWGGPFGTREE